MGEGGGRGKVAGGAEMQHKLWRRLCQAAGRAAGGAWHANDNL